MKFGSHENMLDLLEKGAVYINTLQYFTKLEDSELRGDKFEGATRIVNSLPGTFRIPGIDKDIKFEKVQYTESYEYTLDNVYSLYSITNEHVAEFQKFKIDEKNKRFGTHCVLIKDPDYFLKSLTQTLEKQGRKYYCDFVEYFDREKVSKELNPFEKPLEFAYQEEFRVHVTNDDIKPIKVHIGSLKNKAELLTIEQAMDISLSEKKSIT